MSIEEILDYLNAEHVRCTYKAVGEAIGVHPRSVGRCLGEIRQETSWVVNQEKGEPTGYAPDQKHPQLKEKDHIIRSGAELENCMRNWMEIPAAKANVAVRPGDDRTTQKESGMLPVNSLDQVIENIFLYQSEIQKSRELVRRMRLVRTWYAVRSNEGTWLFAPSTFIGYTKNAAESYLLAAGKEGGINSLGTERILREWFTLPDTDAELYGALQKFLQVHGQSVPDPKIRVPKKSAYSGERTVDASVDPDLQKRIHFDTAICSGRPHIRGTRIRVCDILGMLANGVSTSEILVDYPYLTEADLRAALAFGAAATKHPIIVAA